MSKITKFFKAFILSVIINLVLISFFFLGALSDRLFHIKPLDVIIKQITPSTTFTPNTANKINNPNNNLQTDSIADIAESASKSVVTIAIKKKELKLTPFMLEDFFGINQYNRQQVEEIQRDIGSGFVVENSFVVTNRHVVADTSAVYKVIDNKDKEFEVEKIFRDPTNDLAILKIKDFSVDPLPMGDSDKLRVGEQVIAIGTALGEFRHTVTTGVISGLGRGITAGGVFGGSTEQLENVIQTDAAINPGNSGGPLLDITGHVIGINVAVSQGAENIGFALPINLVRASLDNFNQTGQFDRPYLGVRYQNISKKAALANEIPAGAYIVEVINNSPADKANLKEGDILIEIDGTNLTDQSLATIVNKKKIGDKVRVRYYRWSENKTYEITVTLEASNL